MNVELNNQINISNEEKNISGLKIILNKHLLTQYLKDYLETITTKNLQMTYIRYKPGMNWLVNYEFNNQEHKINIYAKAHGTDKEIKIQKSIKRKNAVMYDIPGRIHFKDEGVVFCVFPNDNKLKYLRLLENKESRKELLNNIFPDNYERWDSYIKFLRYKPERRFVGILSKNSVNFALLRFYTKYDFYKSIKIARLLQSRNLNIPKLLGYSEKFQVLSVGWINGKPLSDILMKDVSLGVKNIYDTGIELSKFHSCNIIDEDITTDSFSFRDYNNDDNQNTFVSLVDQMKLICPKNMSTILEISNFLIKKFSVLSSMSLKEKKNVIIHGDFYAKQVIIDDHHKKISFIDLDEVCIGNPLIDVGNFIAHLYYMVITKRLTKENLKLFINQFICGYKNGIKDNIFDNLTLYVITGLFHLLPHSFRHCEINWIEQTDQITSLMDTMMNDYDKIDFLKNSYP